MLNYDMINLKNDIIFILKLQNKTFDMFMFFILSYIQTEHNRSLQTFEKGMIL